MNMTAKQICEFVEKFNFDGVVIDSYVGEIGIDELYDYLAVEDDKKNPDDKFGYIWAGQDNDGRKKLDIYGVDGDLSTYLATVYYF